MAGKFKLQPPGRAVKPTLYIVSLFGAYQGNMQVYKNVIFGQQRLFFPKRLDVMFLTKLLYY